MLNISQHACKVLTRHNFSQRSILFSGGSSFANFDCSRILSHAEQTKSAIARLVRKKYSHRLLMKCLNSSPAKIVCDLKNTLATVCANVLKVRLNSKRGRRAMNILNPSRWR